MDIKNPGKDPIRYCEDYHANDETSFRAAQVKHLYSQGIAGIRGSFVAAIIMTIFLWNYVSHSCLMIWFVCYAIACGIGEVLSRAIQKTPSLEQTSNDWARRFSALSIVGGILWGSTPILLFPTESISHQALLTFVLGGMSVGITISHGAMRAAHLPFIIAVYIPLIGRYFYSGEESHLVMGVLLCVFMIYLIGAANRMQKTITESLNLRFQKENLIEILTREKSQTDKLNNTLAAEVNERREAERALRESEAIFHQMFEMSPHPMVIYDSNTILSANPSSARLYRASCSNDLVGKCIWDLIHPDSLVESREKMDQMVENREAVQMAQLKVFARDSSVLDVEIVSLPIIYEGLPCVLTIGRDITEAKRAEERLIASLQEKEILLREIHHRVKNNIQVISSLLRLQSRYTGNQSLEDVFSESQNRLMTMALIHEKLYESQDLARIDFQAYIDSLTWHLFQVFGVSKGQITFKRNTERVLLPLDLAIPCGLLVNEILSNSLKHAFPKGTKGLIELSLVSLDGRAELTISDNGIGLPWPVDSEDFQSLGMHLIQTLVRQLKGYMTVQTSGGTSFHIKFPCNGKNGSNSS